MIKSLATLLLAYLALSLPLSVGAATFTVTKETDDNGPCTAEDCALREAIIAANETPGKDLIVVPEGIYPLTIPGVGENDSRTGDLDILEDVEIAAEATATLLGDGADGSDGILEIYSSEVKISRLVFTQGSATGLGGAIFITQGRLELVEAAVVDNRAAGDGGDLSPGKRRYTDQLPGRG